MAIFPQRTKRATQHSSTSSQPTACLDDLFDEKGVQVFLEVLCGGGTLPLRRAGGIRPLIIDNMIAILSFDGQKAWAFCKSHDILPSRLN